MYAIEQSKFTGSEKNASGVSVHQEIEQLNVCIQDDAHVTIVYYNNVWEFLSEV